MEKDLTINFNKELLAKEIRLRCAECDSQGHYAPREDKNICYHCYRSLIPLKSVADGIREERKTLSSWLQPLDAPILIRMDEDAKKTQNLINFFHARIGLAYLFRK